MISTSGHKWTYHEMIVNGVNRYGAFFRTAFYEDIIPEVWRARVDCSLGCLCLCVPRDELMGDKSRLIFLTYLACFVENSGNRKLDIYESFQ